MFPRVRICLLVAGLSCQHGFAQQQVPAVSYTWEQLRTKFEAANPTVQAGKLNIDESKASEVTAYLRPNPDFSLSLDQIDPFPSNPYRPFTYTEPIFSFDYLHEREHKRELRLESAKKGTGVAVAQQADLVRNLLFNLRNSFVQTLQAKSVLSLAEDNLAYYDKLLSVSRERLKAGDIAQVDMDRLDLARAQYETDIQTALVNLRTAKINLLMLLNDRTPVEQFDVTGPFEFKEQIAPLSEFRAVALDARPDLKAAVLSIDKAKTDHKLAVSNGSTDPTFSLDIGRDPPIQAYFGVGVSIPLRIFDRNQGEKERTDIDIRRNERLQEAARAQVFSDVDSAFATLNSNLALLLPYKGKYLQQAVRVRDTISFAYQHGGASLLDFLSAQSDYRSIQLNYLNLIGAYLTAASQLNLAVGREVIQ